MGYISESSSRLKCKQIVKGSQDAAGGSVKHQASMAIIRGTDVIQSAKDFYDFAVKKLENIKNGGACKRRIFRLVL
jgi:hypothetical protein